LPRDLSDVLHFFLPELTPEEGAVASSSATAAMPLAPTDGQDRETPSVVAPRRGGASVLPIVAVPIGDADVLRAALTWNLAVEVARLGGRAAVVAPGFDDASPLWPEPGVGPLGAELIPTPADDLGQLYRVAIDAAVERAAHARDGGVVFVRVPPAWLRAPADDGAGVLRWTLLLTSSHVHDLRETYAVGKLVLGAFDRAEVGVTVHGARSVSEAQNAFGRIARATRAHLGRDLVSYGLLVDDLHVYRAIVAQRPIGLAHPQSPAARALRDVARLVLDDAGKRGVD
jgi:hypothetical protein